MYTITIILGIFVIVLAIAVINLYYKTSEQFTEEVLDKRYYLKGHFKTELASIHKKIRGIENKEILKKYKKMIGKKVNIYCGWNGDYEGKLIDVLMDRDNYIIVHIKGMECIRVYEMELIKKATN